MRHTSTPTKRVRLPGLLDEEKDGKRLVVHALARLLPQVV